MYIFIVSPIYKFEAEYVFTVTYTVTSPENPGYADGSNNVEYEFTDVKLGLLSGLN